MPEPRDTLGRDIGGYVDPPWLARLRAAADATHLERAAEETVTVGQLLDLVQALPAHLPVEFRGCGLDGQRPLVLSSWRGNYADLAIEPGTPTLDTTVGDLDQMLQRALVDDFEGYKGGTFDMDRYTPLWVDEWGGYNPDRGITAVRPLLRRGEAVAVHLVVTDHDPERGRWTREGAR